MARSVYDKDGIRSDSNRRTREIMAQKYRRSPKASQFEGNDRATPR